mgnify:CR=1 FL=1
MNPTPQSLDNKKPHLKVIKNSLKQNKTINRIYINTMFPNFSFRNHLGETIINHQNCVLL